QKLIDDRYSAFEQTQTYLSKEELAFIDPYLKKLNLNEKESGFVKESAKLAEQQIRKEAQRKRSRVYNIVLGIALLISSLSMVAAFLLYGKANVEKQNAEAEKQIAVRALNDLRREQDARDKLDEKLAFYHINVPNFIGKSVDSARVILGEVGLNMVLVSKKTTDYDAGTIIEQNPAAGARLSAVSAVYLTVARRQTEIEKMKDLAKAANLLAGIIAAPEPKIDPYNLTVILPEIAAAMEDSAFLYGVKPLTDNSGIFHRVMKQLQYRLPGIEIPEVANYRTTRDIARWYHEDSTLTFIHDALAQADLIKPGAVMFYGQSDSVYSECTPEILFDAKRGISHIGVVISVQRDSSGVAMNYQLFNGHGRRGIAPASTTNYHWRKPSRKTYPPYGNGRQQWVAIAPIVREKSGQDFRTAKF
ncbi:MAG: PASTA domain-containing protein, partial [bacterium]